MTTQQLSILSTCQDDLPLNRLLAVLPDDALKRLSPHLEKIGLPPGKVLYEPGSDVKNLYFSLDSIVVLLCQMENGASTETAVIGNDGFVGVSLFMGGATLSQAMVQSAGYAFTIKAAPIKTEFDRNGAVMHVLLRYIQALISQTAQTAVCNRHHLLEQQLCRWLLLSLDCLPGNELVITQEVISRMLGVRREGITEAARTLQKLGLIAYRRGHITVLDRPGVEARVCECYAVVKRESCRLLPERLAI